ncbi:MAG: aminopeptidase P family N-terminal domain-containing protein, partial [Anaerolineae bacterium]|nr:aminopeptidase P family N-terminal domain-containing protein [Anaerolineae bacterium]
MSQRRLEQLLDRAGAGGFDAIALMPGPNLFYFTGMTFHISERPIVAIFTTDGRAGVVVPILESATTESSYRPVTPYAYSDEGGYEPAVEEACASLNLAGRKIGVEALQMRLLEMRALEQYAPGCKLLPAEDPLADLRMCKGTAEVAAMRQAIEFT